MIRRLLRVLRSLLQRTTTTTTTAPDRHDTAEGQQPDDAPDEPVENEPEPEPKPAPEPTPEGPEDEGPDEGVNRSSEEQIDMQWPPFVGSDVIPWPEPPDEPENTIEVRLYWPEEKPWVETACHQVTKYVEYCLLDAYADQGYDCDVQVHPDPIPEDVDDFSSWYWSNDVMAKDANVGLKAYGAPYGLAGGYGGWMYPDFFEGWDRDPDDRIKNVGGDGSFSGPTAGVVVLLHEMGHCFGLSHLDRVGNEVRAWGNDYTTPMNSGYSNVTRTRYIFEYHPSVKDRPPKVQ